MGNKSTVMAEYDGKCRLYQNFTSEIEHQLKKLLDAEGIIYNAVTSRLKDRESLSKKIDRKKDKYSALDNLTDIAGVRVITYYAEDVDKVAEIVEREFEVDRKNSIDKRKSLEPDRFGYCSVHYVVEMSQERIKLRENQAFRGLKCEIQIRSVLQHAWAEIEHDLGYKSEIAIPKGIRRNFSRLAGLLEIADKEFQEIRSFLWSYQNEAAEKIMNGEFQDVEIDAVLLKVIVTTNPDIEEINKAIGNYCDPPFDSEFSTELVESDIDDLHWLGIHTVGQLINCIENNKRDAEIVAEKLYRDNIMDLEWSKFLLPEMAAFPCVVLAELLRKNLSADQIMQYLGKDDLGKEGAENFMYFLQQLSEAINKPS